MPAQAGIHQGADSGLDMDPRLGDGWLDALVRGVQSIELRHLGIQFGHVTAISNDQGLEEMQHVRLRQKGSMP